MDSYETNYNMLNWILQFGSSAEVLEPESLREQIKKEINSLKALY
jgi:predicted DNA-binding transcriptional regulator YafY